MRSEALSAIAGGDVYLKLENQQITGSFKLRGALNVLATLPPDVRARGVVASSAGNHGLGVAHAAKHFGTHATIFVPSNAPQVKRDGITALGATIDTTQPHYDAAMDAAKALRGATTGRRSSTRASATCCSPDRGRLPSRSSATFPILRRSS